MAYKISLKDESIEMTPALRQWLDEVEAIMNSHLEHVVSRLLNFDALQVEYVDKFDANLAFEKFWKVYPRKVGKGAAKRKFKTKVKSVNKFNVVMLALREHLPAWEQTQRQFIPHASTWLNGDRWEDEVEMPDTTPQFQKMTDHELVDLCERENIYSQGYNRFQLIEKLEKHFRGE